MTTVPDSIVDRIVAHSTVDRIDVMGNDLRVVNAARVSFGKWVPEHRAVTERDENLIRFLAENGHWTPFGHPQLTFRIYAPFFVRSQLKRHEVGLVWNEVSRRYVDHDPEYFLPSVMRKRPAKGIKQGSATEKVPAHDQAWGEMADHCAEADLTYRRLLDHGVAPEQARSVLPECTMTMWMWTGSLAAFMRIVNLRADSHAQAETQEVALKIANRVQSSFPVSFQYLRGSE